jgi:hypothetical protein
MDPQLIHVASSSILEIARNVLPGSIPSFFFFQSSFSRMSSILGLHHLCPQPKTSLDFSPYQPISSTFSILLHDCKIYARHARTLHLYRLIRHRFSHRTWTLLYVPPSKSHSSYHICSLEICLCSRVDKSAFGAPSGGECKAEKIKVALLIFEVCFSPTYVF